MLNSNIEVCTNKVVSIGRHRLLCGDITKGAVGHLLGDEKVDVIYSDPPWGPGNQQYWHTMRERGSVPATSWSDFLTVFCEVCAMAIKPRSPVMIEMGIRWVDELDGAMARVGLNVRNRWTIFYGPKSKPLPNTLSLYGDRSIDIAMPSPPHGEVVTRAALAAIVKSGDIVLDLCTGLGMTARATHRLGGVFYGTEMNTVRLARTAAWLKKNIEL